MRAIRPRRILPIVIACLLNGELVHALLPLLVGVATAGGCQSQSSVESRNTGTLHRYWKELVNESDVSRGHEIVSPEFTIYFGKEAEQLRGVEFFEGRKQELGTVFSRAELFEDQVIAAGDTIAVRWHGLAVHATDDCFGYRVVPNTEVAYQGMAFYTFDANGLMTEARVIDNLCEVLESRRRTEQERHKALVRRYVDELLNKSDYSKAYEIITPDYAFYRNGQKVAQTGIDVFTAEDDEIEMYSEMRLTDDDMIAEGNTVAVRWRQVAILKPEKSARRQPPVKGMQWHGMSFYKIKDDRIVEGRIVSYEEAITN